MSEPKLAVENILEISPYVPGESLAEGQESVSKLSSNENPFGSSPKAIAAMKLAAEEANLYPDGGSTELRKAIGRANNINPDNIVCGAGSDELIALLCQAYAGVGDEVLMSEYGFLMYPISTLRSGANVVVAEERDLRANVENLLSKVTDKTKLVFIANPNNPTGSYLTRDELKELRGGLADDVLLVVDAAYAEYVTADDYSSGEELILAGNNTVMLRTFSKLYGLASLRLGWAYAPENVVDILNRVRGPFNVSGVAQAAGVAAIEDQEFIDKCVAHNSKWLSEISSKVKELGLIAHPAVANFVLVEFSEDSGNTAQDADKFLKSKGIIGRRMEAYKLPKCMRFSIGTEAENIDLIEALSEFTGKN
jgi:histidinol-phosphate aminotransferase